MSTGRVSFLKRCWSQQVLMMFFLQAFLLTGCGPSNIGQVSGKVTFNGEGVPTGGVLFTPIGQGSNVGRPAAGNIKNGSYSLKDGAVIGQNRISFSAPSVDVPPDKGFGPGDVYPTSPFAGLVPRQKEIEVKKGNNTIDIELVPAEQK